MNLPRKSGSLNENDLGSKVGRRRLPSAKQSWPRYCLSKFADATVSTVADATSVAFVVSLMDFSS